MAILSSFMSWNTAILGLCREGRGRLQAPSARAGSLLCRLQQLHERVLHRCRPLQRGSRPLQAPSARAGSLLCRLQQLHELEHSHSRPLQSWPRGRSKLLQHAQAAFVAVCSSFMSWNTAILVLCKEARLCELCESAQIAFVAVSLQAT